MRIVAVSDVTLGYGSPQVPLLAESLGEFYRGEVKIVEPVQPELAARHDLYPGFEILPVATADHPHSTVGRAEYVWRAAKLVKSLKPDVVVICCTYTLPVLYRLGKKPSKVIYYCYESIPFYGEFDVEMNRRAGSLLDVVLFPEENRAALEIGRCGFQGVPKLVLYNVNNRRTRGWTALPQSGRNGRILYSGTISRSQTFADYYLSDKVRALPIDLFGPVKGEAGDRERFLAQNPRSQPALSQPTVKQPSAPLKYRGVVSGVELAKLRPAYGYSVVSWNPDSENQLYAAPNKFFESIADGVPPIAAPHPQCRLILERYGCGMLMADWSFETFLSALRRALDTYGSAEWLRMVRACGEAVEAELNWEAQFEKVKVYL